MERCILIKGTRSRTATVAAPTHPSDTYLKDRHTFMHRHQLPPHHPPVAPRTAQAAPPRQQVWSWHTWGGRGAHLHHHGPPAAVI